MTNERVHIQHCNSHDALTVDATSWHERPTKCNRLLDMCTHMMWKQHGTSVHFPKTTCKTKTCKKHGTMGYLQIVVETSPGTVMYTHNRAVTKACNHCLKQLLKLTLLTYGTAKNNYWKNSKYTQYGYIETGIWGSRHTSLESCYLSLKWTHQNAISIKNACAGKDDKILWLSASSSDPTGLEHN